jgi:hypothetical protein
LAPLKKIEDWPIWFFRVKNIMVAQGMKEILNPGFSPDPLDPKALDDWEQKLFFTYMMLAERVMGHTSKRIVRENEDTRNGQITLFKLAEQAKTSTEAVLTRRRTMAHLTSQKYDPKMGSALEFITTFEEMIESHNAQQSEPGLILTGAMKKSFLQTSLANVMMLRAVTDWENDTIVRGGSSFTYEEYLQAAKASAALYDQKSSGHRAVHMSKVKNNESGTSIVDEITEYYINLTKRRAPGATMNKETWQGISEEGKVVWDKLGSSDKQKILQYAMKRASAKDPVSVNQTILHDLDNAFEAMSNETEFISPEPENVETLEGEINQAVSKARSEAHPGDVRRVMAGKPKKKTVTQVKFAQWMDHDPAPDPDTEEREIDDMLEGYNWGSDDEGYHDPDDEDESQDFHRDD